MVLRKYAFSGTCAVLLIGAVIYVEFFVMPSAKGGSKPSRRRLEAFREVEANRQKTYVKPIAEAISSDDFRSVQSVWLRYAKSSAYEEDPMLRLQIARYYVRKGKATEAHEQLDKILNPPRGSFSTLQSSGEVMSLWLQTDTGETATRKAAVEQEFQKATERVFLPESGPLPTGVARVEYLAAQEMEALMKPKEALAHFERAVALEPGNSFLWLAVSDARKSSGDVAGAKAAMVHAYWTASPTDRANIKRYHRLTNADIENLRP